jgi:N-methylhydantoinase A
MKRDLLYKTLQALAILTVRFNSTLPAEDIPFLADPVSTSPLSISHVLGISVDESFAEFNLLKVGKAGATKSLSQQRNFLPRESLKNSLRKFLERNSETPVDRVYISLRFLEKILDYRLGGSVAQLVTEGFEHWMQIRSADPSAKSLSNPDLIFSVKERVCANGEILQEIQEEDLAMIEAKLKLMEVKRVCLHFLHAQLQPQNQKRAQTYFLEHGFDVFVPPRSENPDEVSRWRANTLNASVSGTFLELHEEILLACEGLVPTENIFYISGEKKVFQKENHLRLGSLFSTRAALLQVEKEPVDLLYLGLEKFSWLKTGCDPVWQSPWGEVELAHPFCVDLEIQPTSAITLNEFDEMDFSEKVEGYEPGPMSMGRGQKPTFLDLFGDNETLLQLEGVADRIAPTGFSKFKNALTALSKGHSGKRAEPAETLIQNLRTVALRRLSMEMNLHADKIKLVGPLAPLLGKNLIADNKNWTVANHSFSDSEAVAQAGLIWQVNS